jgi:soluble lytic murein transglycosylase-like protein
VIKFILSLVFIFLLVPSLCANEIIDLITAESKSSDLDPKVMINLAKVESGLKANAISRDRVNYGVFQISKRTGRVVCNLTIKQLLNPTLNIKCAMTYFMSFYERHKSYPRAVAEFNAGRWTASAAHPDLPVNYRYVHRVLTLN